MWEENRGIDVWTRKIFQLQLEGEPCAHIQVWRGPIVSSLCLLIVDSRLPPFPQHEQIIQLRSNIWLPPSQAILGKVKDMSPMKELGSYLGTEDPFIFLYGTYVPPASRRLGLGHMIVNKTMQMLLESHPDIHRIVSLGPVDIEEAEKFYTSLGFEDAGVTVKCDTINQDFRIFVKECKPPVSGKEQMPAEPHED